MARTELSIPAGEFKAKCLKLMDDAQNQHMSFIITKHGKPIARLIPFQEQPINAFGCMQNTVTIVGDIINPIDAHWESNDE